MKNQLSGCRVCNVLEAVHGTRWLRGFGWHTFVAKDQKPGRRRVPKGYQRDGRK